MRPLAPQPSRKLVQLFQQANQFHVSGELTKAKEGYLHVLKSQANHFEALYLLGVIGCQERDFLSALGYLKRAVQLSPRPNYYYSLGVAYQELGQLEQAQASYESALKAQPNYPDALYNLGNAWRKRAEHAKSIHYFDQALVLTPAFTHALYNKANALKDLGEYAAAVQCFDRVLALDSNYVGAYLNKGLSFKAQGALEAALACYAQALRVNPRYSDAYSNMGIVYTEQKLWAQANASLQAALDINPLHAQALWNKSLLLLLHGQLSAGFALYEARWRDEVMISRPLVSAKPLYTHTAGAQFGQSMSSESPVAPALQSKRLLLWAEQGIGDEVMFGALLGAAQNLAKKVLVQLDERLLPLFRRSFPQFEFFPKNAVIDEDLYDYHLPIGGLARLFAQDNNTFGDALGKSYLKSDTARTSAIKERMEDFMRPRTHVGALKIGISWRSKNDQRGADRSVHLDQLVGAIAGAATALSGSPRVQCIDLQYKSTAEELLALSHKLGIEVLSLRDMDNFSDIDGLASLIDACDAVVSVDNSTVHLAGALGKPCWVLLPFSADWRWGVSDAHSYWYASLRLIRQSVPGRWQEVLEQVQRELISVLPVD